MIRQTKSKQRNLETPINRKRTTFQQQIRRARVQQLIKKMREQLITSICEDFHTLKNIDLDQCFDLIGQIKVEAIAEELSTLDNLVLNMYSYCVSNRSDHMYSLIRDSTLQKMIEMIAWARIESYSAKPRVYVRLMWILSNYCTYATTAPPAYFKTITELLKHFSSSLAYQDKKDLLFFTHAQAKLIVQLLFWSLGEVQISQQACLSYFVDKEQGFITAGVNESKKIVQLLKDHTLQQTDREMSILLHIIKMFQKFVTLSQYPKDLLQTILDFDYQIVNNLLEILSYVRMRYQTIEIVVAECFHSFFMQNLSQRPVILLSHRFNLLFECFQQTAENVVLWHSQMLNFHKKLDIQGESKATMAQLGNQATQSEYRLSRWLGVMVAIFGLNIPQNQDEKSYYQLQMGWLEDYLLPTFAKLLRLPQLKSRQLTTKIMNILQNICLDQALCELMLSQLAVANFIFRNCRAAQVRVDLRKGSLLCLANLTRMSMDAELRPKVLQFMDKKEIASIFAKYVGQFSEAGINFSLLQGLKTMLDVEPCETKKQNEIWWQFCSQGGRYKLEKLVQASGKEWKDLIIFAESIMKQYEDAEL